ncbi:serine/threonine-protein kinase [Mycolicibacterium thermoresistibile]
MRNALTMLPVGSMVAGYRIEGVLGTGGMGTVYLAKNPTLPRHDALKVLSTELSQDSGFRERFIKEADVASVLDHPNIVSIYTRGETDEGQLWIAMQYVPGTDAEAALRSGTMTPWRATHIIGEVAKALDYAHHRNVVHHDVKPANFLLSDDPGDDEKVLLSDFGVARALDDGGTAMDNSLIATLAYAAPEVIAGGAIDGRADLYSLACTLFRMLSGRKPFHQADGPAAIMLAHLHQEAPRLSEYVPWSSPQLDWVIAKALAKDPEQRFQSAREFARTAAAAVREAAPPPDAVREAPPPMPPPRPHFNPPPQDAPPPPPPAPAPDARWTAGAQPPVGAPPPGGAYPPPSGPLPPVSPRSAAPVHGGGPQRNRRLLVAGAAGVAAVAVVGGLVLWLLRPASGTDDAAAADTAETTTSAPRDTAAENRLLTMLPPGYAAGACGPVPAPEGALAQVVCRENTDPGGPPTATYTLARDEAAMQEAFDEIVSASATVNCPNFIQSPGPWRRNATPERISGTLFCGIQQNEPLVAWTDDANLLVSAVHSGPQGPTLDELYAWWTSHS